MIKHSRLLCVAATMLAAGLIGTGVSATENANPNAEDVAKVNQCLEAVRKAGSDPRACIGVVADPCLELPEQASTIGAIDCITRETKLWSEFLSDRWRSVLALVDGEQGERLREVDAAWSTYRDKRCGLGEVLFPGGTVASVWAAECMLQETGRRAVEAGVLLEELSAR